jgi:hypothetical protein
MFITAEKLPPPRSAHSKKKLPRRDQKLTLPSRCCTTMSFKKVAAATMAFLKMF